MDLNNSANWSLISTQTKTVVETSVHPIYKRSYLPLQPSLIRVTSPIIQILINTEDSPPTWHRAGWISFFAQINNQATLIDKRGLQLREYNLLNFPFYGEELVPFQIELEFPFWFKNVTFSIWEFLDSSGRYVPSNVEQSLLDLEDKLNGETISLQLISVTPLQEGDTTLYQKRYEGTTSYETFEVGRFKSGNQVLTDPIVQILPNKLVAIFTSAEETSNATITVSVKPL